MNARNLLEELAILGIELRADGAELEYEGSEETITPQLLDCIKSHKGELLTLLAWDEDDVPVVAGTGACAASMSSSTRCPSPTRGLTLVNVFSY